MFDLFRHFGLTIAFVFNVGFVIWQKPFANNRQNAGNNIIKLMTSVNKILSLDENNFNKKKIETKNQRPIDYEKHIKNSPFHQNSNFLTIYQRI